MSSVRDYVHRITGRYSRNEELYEEALRHKTVSGKSNERLECLGDAVLGLISCEYLYFRYPDINEGVISRLRMKIVCGSALLEYATSIDLHDNICHGLDAPCDKVTEDAFEALLGAIYLDMGYRQAFDFVILLFKENFPDKRLWLDTNYKDCLNKLQKKIGARVKYQRINEPLDSLDLPLDQVSVQVNVGSSVFYGTGKTQKSAEQNASYIALTNLGVKSFLLGQDPDKQFNEYLTHSVQNKLQSRQVVASAQF